MKNKYKSDKYQCYRLGNNIYTPVDIVRVYNPKYSFMYEIYLNNRSYREVGHKVKLRNPTLLDKIRLVPAVSAAILARLVRKIEGVKRTKLEDDLLRFYYEQEVKVRGSESEGICLKLERS